MAEFTLNLLCNDCKIHLPDLHLADLCFVCISNHLRQIVSNVFWRVFTLGNDFKYFMEISM